ncbi:MAG: peptidase [Neisseriaceae bacterium]|nr:peptidase [Neisseriaceae bacterium]MBR6026812.1 peptidase [Neisseriaceae bacterium]
MKKTFAILLALFISTTAYADNDEMHYQQHKDQYITYEKAAEIALQHFEKNHNKKGMIDEVDFEHKFSGDYFDVEIKDEMGREYEIRIVAKTGKVLYMKLDD